MDENELKDLWLNASHQHKVEISPDKLIEILTQKISNMEKLVKRRDRIEIFLSSFMIALFTWWLFVVPLLLVKMGSAIILTGCFLVIFKLISVRRATIKQETASEIKYHLLVSLQQVREQINLQKTIFWWYLLPFFLGIECFFCAYVNSIMGIVVYTLIVGVLYGYIWYMNKKAVKLHLGPLETNLMRALDELSATEK